MPDDNEAKKEQPQPPQQEGSWKRIRVNRGLVGSAGDDTCTHVRYGVGPDDNDTHSHGPYGFFSWTSR